MGLIGNLFQNDKLEELRLERDYYKGLYEAKLLDMDAMRQMIAQLKDRNDVLSAQILQYEQLIKRREGCENEVAVPDKELLF